MNAGYCVFDSGSGTVTCTQPSVTVNKLPAFCNLAFESAASVTVRMAPGSFCSTVPIHKAARLRRAILIHEPSGMLRTVKQQVDPMSIYPAHEYLGAQFEQHRTSCSVHD
jgi:hypothetical protein